MNLYSLNFYIIEMNVLTDLKPANIFLTSNEVIKIGDFGMAEMRSGTAKEQPMSVLGTPYYMSPERLLQRPYSSNCDVWSLGCVMYEVSFSFFFYINENIYLLERRISSFRHPVKFCFKENWFLRFLVLSFISYLLQIFEQ